MTSSPDIVRTYIDVWNTVDPTARKAAIAAAFTEDVHYVDPLSDVTGHDGIGALVAGTHEQFPGTTFTPHGEADAHHDLVRFGWALGPDGVEPPVLGFDVLRLAADGRIAEVHGFFDRVPAG